MVNDYYVGDNSSTSMAQSKELFISCKTFKNDLTEKDFRENIDFAWRRVQDFKEKKINKAEEIPRNDGAFCTECGSMDLSPSGNCKVCRTCGKSQGCS